MANAARRNGKTAPVLYPDLAAIFNRELLKWNLPRISAEVVRGSFEEWKAEQSGKRKLRKRISRSAVFNYLKGYRKPIGEFIDFFCQMSFKDDEELQGNLRIEIDAAKEKPLQHTRLTAPSGGILKALEAGQPLRFMSVAYQPIAGPPLKENGPKSFFESIFGRAFKLSQLKTEDRGLRAGLNSNEYTSAADIHFGVFNSPDRLLGFGLRFWRLPIRMSLGAVCWTDDIAGDEWVLEEVRNRLIGIEKEIKPRRKVRPLVVKNDIGAIYCENTLQFGKDEFVEVPDPGVLSLEEAMNRMRAGDPDRTVVCTDEFTSIELHRKLGADSLLVFPLNSKRTSGWAIRKDMPQYFASIAIDRMDGPFREFLSEALAQVLSTEIESTAKDLRDLALKLIDLVTDSVKISLVRANSKLTPEEAKLRAQFLSCEWVFYALCLDLNSIESFSAAEDLPWKPILLRTRDMVYEWLVNEGLIRDWIKGLNEGKGLFEAEPASGGKVATIPPRIQFCTCLDISIDPEDVFLRDSDFIDLLQKKLIGNLSVRVDIEETVLRDSDARERPTLRDTAARLAMRIFLRSLQNEYDLLAASDPFAEQAVSDISRAVISLASRGGSEKQELTFHSIVLAKQKGAPREYVGGACIFIYPGPRCELKYLWVSPHYRNLKIGTEIVEYAERVAREKNCKSIDLKVLANAKVLKTAFRLFSSCGFSQSSLPSEGRTLFSKSLSRKDERIPEPSPRSWNFPDADAGLGG